MRRLNVERGLSFLIVTHDIAVGRKTDRIIRMLDGPIVEEQLLEVRDMYSRVTLLEIDTLRIDVDDAVDAVRRGGPPASLRELPGLRGRGRDASRPEGKGMVVTFLGERGDASRRAPGLRSRAAVEEFVTALPLSAGPRALPGRLRESCRAVDRRVVNELFGIPLDTLLVDPRRGARSWPSASSPCSRSAIPCSLRLGVRNFGRRRGADSALIVRRADARHHDRRGGARHRATR